MAKHCCQCAPLKTTFIGFAMCAFIDAIVMFGEAQYEPEVWHNMLPCLLQFATGCALLVGAFRKGSAPVLMYLFGKVLLLIFAFIKLIPESMAEQQSMLIIIVDLVYLLGEGFGVIVVYMFWKQMKKQEEPVEV